MRMNNENRAIWALSSIQGLGFTRIRILIGLFGTAEKIFEQPVELLTESDSISMAMAKKIKSLKKWEMFEKEYADSIPDGSEFVSLSDDKYPFKLKNIPDPPPFFYYKGSLDILKKPCLAIVGSRTPTDYGLRVTEKMASVLAVSGVTIISGLAYGIDASAHEAAIKSGGGTVAVFGSGLDIITPAIHRKLARDICTKGCLISEFPKGTEPTPYNFPVRNRIISGLADGVLVVEAMERSGALITANLALEQGRDVLAVPGNIDSKLSAGPNNLLKQGAIPVSSARDVFDNFGWHKPEGQSKQAIDKSSLKSDEKKIYEYLSVKPVHLDEIIRKSGLGHGKTADAILNLELKGFIIRKPGNYLVVS